MAVLGLGRVLGLPGLAEALAPALARLREAPGLLNGARGLAALALMLLPATAMGASLTKRGTMIQSFQFAAQYLDEDSFIADASSSGV